MKSCFKYWTKVLLLIVFSMPVFAHNGSHETKNCFIDIGDNQLRFSGYQFQGLHPDAAYCRVFPFLGLALIKLEAINSQASDKQVTLQLIKLNNLSIVKNATFHSFKEVVMLQETMTERGIYALDITLQDHQQPPLKARFYFLIGIPITQILVITSFILLLLIAGIFFSQHRKQVTGNSQSSAKMND